MSEQIRWLDELGGEFARVAAAEPRRTSLLRRRRIAALVSALVLAGGAYAVPVTRGAIGDVARWIAGEDGAPPGRALRPHEDAPDWVRDGRSRVIAERDGVRLFVTRAHTERRGTLLGFTFGGGTVFDSVDGWRKRFEQHAMMVLGTAPRRYALFGVTARSVARVELRYASGPPLEVRGLHGGFVLLPDAHRPLREIVAYDAAGRELERADVSMFSAPRSSG